MKAARWSDLRGKERKDKPWLDGLPRTIFVGDMGDFCSKSVPDEYIESEIFRAIKSPEGQRHFWLLLTKQIQRLAKLSEKMGELPDNCMAMTTVTDQYYADMRIPWLLRTRCKWRGVSVEPMLGPVRLTDVKIPADALLPEYGTSYGFKFNALSEDDEHCFYSLARLNWAIAGGESGDNYRTPELAWMYKVSDDCHDCGVPVFIKQDSGPRPGLRGRIPVDRCFKEMPGLTSGLV